MKNFLVICGLLFSLLSAPLAHADLTEQQRIADAEQLVNLFHHRYAPMSWKEKLWHIDRNELANTLMEEAANAKNDIEFYEAVVHYLTALKDAHVSWEIPSTAKYGYGVAFNYFGKSILVKIFSKQVQADHPEIAAGDILLTVNGEPAENELEKVLRYVNNGNGLTDKEDAAKLLSYRLQSRFPSTPHDGDKVVLGLRSAKTKQEYSIELTWERFAGFDIANMNQPDIHIGKASILTKAQALGEVSHEENSITIPNGSFPLWNSFVLRNEKPFVSGIFIANGKRIGFLRLHTWMLSDLNISTKDARDFLSNEISFLQNNTDALLIDQNDNGGGLGCFAETVAGFFTDTPKPSLLFALKPTRSWLVKYEGWLADTHDGWTQRLMKREIAAIREALNNGDDLTKPIPNCNDSGMIEPFKDQSGNKVTYTHPVLLLVNQDSCSAADMFPAMMQDAGEATIFGTKTIGCGGNVEEEDFLGYSDLKVHFTASMMVRAKTQTLPNGTQTNYIENVGVTPDIPYEFSEKDFYDHYAAYRKAIEKAVLDLIQK